MSDHVWRVGDLCTCTYNETAGGIIYRVAEVDTRFPNADEQLKLQPVFGIFNPVFNRKRDRKIGAGWCQPLDLVSMGVEYMKLGTFLVDEAVRRGMSPVEAGDEAEGT